MTYTVVLLKEEVGGYSVLVPALPGCFSQGDTVPEALENAREAICCHLASLMQHGQSVPMDVDTVAFEWGGAQEAYVYRVATRQEEAVPVA
ncbi:MAG: type II toxin-antitoxin system HicB family antitoxin [Armatimonadetes bacterium]|nr:type II toxin-antitoxin system HicB family antitoxin [Armatimonadota bacterium]